MVPLYTNIRSPTRLASSTLEHITLLHGVLQLLVAPHFFLILRTPILTVFCMTVGVLQHPNFRNLGSFVLVRQRPLSPELSRSFWIGQIPSFRPTFRRFWITLVSFTVLSAHTVFTISAVTIGGGGAKGKSAQLFYHTAFAAGLRTHGSVPIYQEIKRHPWRDSYHKIRRGYRRPRPPPTQAGSRLAGESGCRQEDRLWLRPEYYSDQKRRLCVNCRTRRPPD